MRKIELKSYRRKREVTGYNKKDYDKIRERGNLKESKENQRDCNRISYEKVKEEREEKGIIPPNEEEMVKGLQMKSYDKSKNEKREIK